VLAAVLAGAPPAPAAVELLDNPGLETPNATLDGPQGWTPSTWGTAAPLFSWSSDAHTGERSVRVDVTGYQDGDSKWVHDPVAVQGGTYYVFSDWYKSTATSAVSVYYETAGDPPDGGRWANLFSGIAPSSEWTPYQTGFTMPAGAVRAVFVHFLAGDGQLVTDDYSLTAIDAPPGFERTMASLTFDDGSRAFYELARPLLDAKGFKTTQYIPTKGLSTTPTDPFMMTLDQVRAVAAAGHEIGSHSVSHDALPTLSDAALAAELRDSKARLEQIAGRPGSVTSIAYPYGLYDARVIAAAKAAGYRSGRVVDEGYTSRLDLEPLAVRAQNMTRTTTTADVQSWIVYAAAHRYWLVIVYHEVVPDSAPVCTDPETVSPCLGPYDTTVSQFRTQLDLLAAAGVDVVPFGEAFARAQRELHGPTPGTVRLSDGAPVTDAVITAEPAGFRDADGDILAYHFRWFVDGAEVSSAARLNLGEAGHGDRGDEIRVEVTATDPDGHTSAPATATATVANSRPAAGAVTIAPSAPTTATTALTATPSGFTDADGDPLTYAYTWLLNGGALAAGPQVTGFAGHAGDVVTVIVRAGDGDGTASATAAATIAAVPVADTAPPSITITRPRGRTYRRKQTITVRFAAKDPSGVARVRATVRRRGGPSRTVRSGGKLRLARAGRYTLRVVATDRAGNAATRTVSFRVR
jgi:peptidoglycan/xylan/chitin deacetylase (PgdA/CDA1 family)